MKTHLIKKPLRLFLPFIRCPSQEAKKRLYIDRNVRAHRSEVTIRSGKLKVTRNAAPFGAQLVIFHFDLFIERRIFSFFAAPPVRALGSVSPINPR